MLPQITQQNLFLLIPSKAAAITAQLREHYHLSLKSALLTFYHSRAYAILEQERTKLWHQSAEQIYAEYFPANAPKKTCQHGPGKSKLSPYKDQILQWKKQGMSLQGIADKLMDRGCVTTPQNIWSCLKRIGPGTK